MKKLLFIILFLIISKFAFCADINWSLEGTSVTTIISGTETGSDSNASDNNVATSSGSTGALTNVSSFSYSITNTFKNIAQKINSIELLYSGGAALGRVSTGALAIYLYYGSSWHSVYSSSTWTGSNVTISVSGPWLNVDKIKVEHSGSARELSIGAKALALGYTSELRAFGPAKSKNQVITFF